jgi:hypothetical protein
VNTGTAAGERCLSTDVRQSLPAFREPLGRRGQRSRRGPELSERPVSAANGEEFRVARVALRRSWGILVRRSLRRAKRVNPRARHGAVEAAAVVDERNGPLAHNGLENAARFPQLPQPKKTVSERRQWRTYNASRPHLSQGPFWSEEWGPPQATARRVLLIHGALQEPRRDALPRPQRAHGNFTGEIITSFKNRPEGIRVKHWVRGNSIKTYDKAGGVFRVETTIARTRDFKVLRPVHDDPHGKLEWRPLRKGVADLHRRAELSQRTNNAYLDALAAVDDTTPCAKLFDTVSRPLLDGSRRIRALRLGDRQDLSLLDAVSRGEFATAGLRNRDIRALIHRPTANLSPSDIRRLSTKTTRQLRLLRAHGVIKKIPRPIATGSPQRAISSPPPSSPPAQRTSNNSMRPPLENPRLPRQLHGVVDQSALPVL